MRHLGTAAAYATMGNRTFIAWETQRQKNWRLADAAGRGADPGEEGDSRISEALMVDFPPRTSLR